MRIKALFGAATMSAVLVCGAARADVSIMYADWLAALVEPGIAAYEEATGEKVEAIQLPGEGYVERVALDLASGTAADVIQMDSFVVSELASAGYVASLDEKLAGWDQYKHYLAGLIEVVSYNGNVYALPTDSDVRMLWYSVPVMEAAGIALPWEPKNWDDILAAARQIKEKTGIEDAFALPAGTKRGEATTMQGFYMALLGADVPEAGRNRLRDWDAGKWVGDSPAIRRTLELYKTVYVDEKLGTQSLHYTGDVDSNIRAGLRDGTIGIVASGSWENACLWDCNGENLPSQEERDAAVGWTPWPGSGVDGAMPTTNISGGWAIGLNAKSDNDEAFALLTAIFDYERFAEWTIRNNRMAVRSDISESEAYAENPFFAKATPLASTTTGRDTYPGYQIVSALVQQMTADILEGVSVEEAVEEYKAALIDEFGEDNVLTYE